MNRVESKTAIVTGGASGIGRASALLLAAEGAKIVIADRDEERGRAVAGEIIHSGGKAIWFALDVADEPSWIALIAETQRQFDAVNIVVNNAGIALRASVEGTTLAEWQRIIAVNLTGVFLGTKHGIIGMRDQIGSIINISSVNGLVGNPDSAAYDASKGGVRNFTKSAALHCGKLGYRIRVNSVHPGYIRTPMVENMTGIDSNVTDAWDMMAKLHPIGHIGEANDIAYGVLYLASDESKFVTGSELVIDGGYTAQ